MSILCLLLPLSLLSALGLLGLLHLVLARGPLDDPGPTEPGPPDDGGAEPPARPAEAVRRQD